MRTIHRYPFQVFDKSIELPAFAQPINVGIGRGDGNGQASLWAVIDSDMPMVRTVIFVAGTGGELDESCIPENHVGTWMDGFYVWHLFMPKGAESIEREGTEG